MNDYEVFYDVAGYEGLYMVNKNGDIKTLRNRNGRKGTLLKPFIDKDGYCRVRLYKNGKGCWIGVHKIVAMTFIPNPDNRPIPNHKDFDRSNNRVDNLEWCTVQENIHHSSKHYIGLHKKAVISIDKDGNETEYVSVMEASKITKTHISNISKCCNGNRNTANGYVWKWKTERNVR